MEPVEALFHFGHEKKGYWRWYLRVLCPPCRVAAKAIWGLSDRDQLVDDVPVELEDFLDVEAEVA